MPGFCRLARQQPVFCTGVKPQVAERRLVIGQPRLAAENEAECVAREVCGTPAGRGINPFFPGEFQYVSVNCSPSGEIFGFPLTPDLGCGIIQVPTK